MTDVTLAVCLRLIVLFTVDILYGLFKGGWKQGCALHLPRLKKSTYKYHQLAR